MKKILFAVLISGVLISCVDPGNEQAGRAATDTSTDSEAGIITSVADTPSDEEHAIYYLTIADTGSNYNLLDRKMYELAKQAGLAIDTMNRHYDKANDKIALREDDEDEMYRGEYFPRRYPGEALSLEYLTFYDDNAQEQTMVLVSGIYENKEDAAVALMKLKTYANGAYMLKANVYVGCMH